MIISMQNHHKIEKKSIKLYFDELKYDNYLMQNNKTESDSSYAFTALFDESIDSIEYVKMRNRVKLSLDYADDVKDLKDNPMYHIMSDLYIKLNAASSLEVFYQQNSPLESWIKYFSNQMDNVAPDTELKTKFQILGKKLEDMLDGRFVKEKRDPMRNMKQNTIFWYKSNSKINPETDTDIVQAGCMTCFLLAKKFNK